MGTRRRLLAAGLFDDRDKRILHGRRVARRGRARRRTSAGVPSANTRPASMMAIRSQYSASSIKCVVTMTVTPCWARAVIRLQNSRRARGSTPLVGSSRNRVSGSCNRAAAIDKRCLNPPGSWALGESRELLKSNCSSAQSMRSRLRLPRRP